MLKDLSLFQAIVDQLPLAIFAKDPSDDFRIVLWNQRATQLWEFKKEQALGKTDFDLFTPESARFFRENDIQTLRENKLIFFERELVENKHHGRCWVSTWKIPVRSPDGKVFLLLGVSQDVTELVMSEQRKQQTDQLLALQREKLGQASRLAALGEMASGVAHEINTPLGVISLHAEVALSMVEEGTLNIANLENHLKKIQETTFRIAKIVQTMKSVTRNEQIGQHEWIHFRSALEDLRALSQYRLKHEEVQLDYQTVPDDIFLHCQGVQLSQVLLNLLNNSIDAIRKDRNSKWVRVELEVIDQEWCEIRVRDSGQGISADVQGKMFDTFFTTKSAQEGTGLGLSISKGILQMHGGDLYFDDSSGMTTFVLRWPCDRLKRQNPT